MNHKEALISLDQFTPAKTAYIPFVDIKRTKKYRECSGYVYTHEHFETIY